MFYILMFYTLFACIMYNLHPICTLYTAQVVRKVADCNAARVSLAADMADDSQRIKVDDCDCFLSFIVVY